MGSKREENEKYETAVVADLMFLSTHHSPPILVTLSLTNLLICSEAVAIQPSNNTGYGYGAGEGKRVGRILPGE